MTNDPGTRTDLLPAVEHERVIAFVERYPDACMVTLRRDGSAHMARIEVGVVDGRIMGSGAPDLLRTRHLRRDPRCSLFVFGPHPHWLGLETEVTIMDGADAPPLLVGLMRARHGDAAPPGMVLAHDDELGHDRPYLEAELLEHLRTQRGLVYQFTVKRAYGKGASGASG